MKVVNEKGITIEKLSYKTFEGWKTKYNGIPCGYVKFKPYDNEIFKKHATVDIHITKTLRGRHIGRIALKLAIEASKHHLFVAYLAKSNIACERLLTSTGFTPAKIYTGKQLCMLFKKI